MKPPTVIVPDTRQTFPPYYTESKWMGGGGSGVAVGREGGANVKTWEKKLQRREGLLWGL